MSGQTNRLMVYAFHQAAVASNNPCFMVHQIVTENRIQMPLGNRHAHRHRQTLPQGPGRGFHTFQLEILRVTRARAVQLAEIADVIHGRPRITGQVQRGIGQHRSMSCRQHKTVAVWPFRVGGIEF